MLAASELLMSWEVVPMRPNNWDFQHVTGLPLTIFIQLQGDHHNLQPQDVRAPIVARSEQHPGRTHKKLFTQRGLQSDKKKKKVHASKRSPRHGQHKICDFVCSCYRLVTWTVQHQDSTRIMHSWLPLPRKGQEKAANYLLQGNDDRPKDIAVNPTVQHVTNDIKWPFGIDNVEVSTRRYRCERRDRRIKKKAAQKNKTHDIAARSKDATQVRIEWLRVFNVLLIVHNIKASVWRCHRERQHFQEKGSKR